MTGAYYFLVLLWPIIGAVPKTQLLPPPVIAEGVEAGSVLALDENGVERWTAQWTMRENDIDGQPTIRMEERGQGRYSGFEDQIRWLTETLWHRGDVFRPLETEKTFWDTEGQPLLRQRTEFDHGNNTIRFEREDLRTGASTLETWDMPEDTLSVEGFAAALRAMPFDGSRSIRAHLFTSEPGLYDVNVEMRGRETLRTRTDEFETYKVEVVPRLGFLSLFRFLLPKAYFWFEVNSSRTWVRFEGPENGRGTPTITIERVD